MEDCFTMIFFEKEFYRHLEKLLAYKPVTEERYEQLIIPLKVMGVTILRGTEEVEKHLDFVDAQASNVGEDIVLFRRKISVSAILEETHHVIQNKCGLNDDKDFELRTILNEIDAKEFLLRVAGQYGIPRQEIEETKVQLKKYQTALKEYYKERGEEDV